MGIFDSGAGIFGSSRGIFGSSALGASPNFVTQEQLDAIQQLIEDERRRKQKSEGGGGWSWNPLTWPKHIPIPYVGRGLSQIAEGLVWGTAGLPFMVADAAKGIYADVRENPWTLAAGPSAPLLAAVARGGESELYKDVGKPMGQAFYEDFRHPLRNIGYLALDVAGVASLGYGTGARVAAAAGRAGRAARGGRAGPAATPSGTPPPTAPGLGGIAAEMEPGLAQAAQKVAETLQAEQRAEVAPIFAQLSDTGLPVAPVQPPPQLALPAAPQRLQLAPPAIPSLDELIRQPGGLPAPPIPPVPGALPEALAVIERTQGGIPSPVRPGMTLDEIRAAREADSARLMEEKEALGEPIAESLDDAAQASAEARPGIDLEKIAALRRAEPKTGWEQMLADIIDEMPTEMSPQQALDAAAAEVMKRLERHPTLVSAFRAGVAPEDILQGFSDRILDTARAVQGLERKPVLLPDLTQGAIEAERGLKRQRAKQLGAMFDSEAAKTAYNKLDAIGGHLVSETDFMAGFQRSSGRRVLPYRQFETRPRAGTSPEDFDLTVSRLDYQSPIGVRRTGYGTTGFDDRPRYRLTENGEAYGPEFVDSETARRFAQREAAEEHAGLPRDLRVLARGGQPLVRLGKKAREAQGRDIVNFQEAQRIAEERFPDKFKPPEDETGLPARSPFQERSDEFTAGILGEGRPVMTPDDWKMMKEKVPPEAVPFLDELERMTPAAAKAKKAAIEEQNTLARMWQEDTPMSPSDPVFEQLRLKSDNLSPRAQQLVARAQRRDLSRSERMIVQRSLAEELMLDERMGKVPPTRALVEHGAPPAPRAPAYPRYEPPAEVTTYEPLVGGGKVRYSGEGRALQAPWPWIGPESATRGVGAIRPSAALANEYLRAGIEAGISTGKQGGPGGRVTRPGRLGAAAIDLQKGDLVRLEGPSVKPGLQGTTGEIRAIRGDDVAVYVPELAGVTRVKARDLTPDEVPRGPVGLEEAGQLEIEQRAPWERAGEEAPPPPERPVPGGGPVPERPPPARDAVRPELPEEAPRKRRHAEAGELRKRDIKKVAPGRAATEQTAIAKQMRNEIARRKAAGDVVTPEALQAIGRAAGLTDDEAKLLVRNVGEDKGVALKVIPGQLEPRLREAGVAEADIPAIRAQLKAAWKEAKDAGQKHPPESRLRGILDPLDAKYGPGTGDELFRRMFEYTGGTAAMMVAITGALTSILAGGADVGMAAMFGARGAAKLGGITPRTGPPTFGFVAAEFLRGLKEPVRPAEPSVLTRLTKEGERKWAADVPVSRNPLTALFQRQWHEFLQRAADDVQRAALEERDLGGGRISRAKTQVAAKMWQHKVDYYSRLRERLMAPFTLRAKEQVYQAERERIEAGFDAQGMAPDAKAKLMEEWEKEAGPSPFAEHAERAAATPSTRFIGRLADSANQLASLMLLYLKPGYLPPNVVGQILFTTIDHNWNMFSIYRANKVAHDLMREFPEIDTFAQELAGAGPAMALRQERGVSRRLQRSQEAMAKIWSKMMDDPDILPFRRLAITNELIRRGYRTAADQAQVYNSYRQIARWDELSAAEQEVVAKHWVDLEASVMEGNRSIVDYGNLGREEKRIVRRMVLFYPWIKGATKYAGRFIAHHPTQAAINQQLGKFGEERAREELGDLPSYLAGVIPMPKAIDKIPVLSYLLGPSTRNVPGVGEQPRFFNPQALSVLGTGGEILNMARAMALGDVRAVERPAGLLNPVLGAAAAGVLRTDPFFGGAIPPGESVPSIMYRELAQTNLPGQAIASAIGAITGKAPSEIPVLRDLPEILIPSAKSTLIESGEINPAETLLPSTAAEERGRYLTGLYPQTLNRPVARERAQAEAFSLMSKPEAAKARWKEKIRVATMDARQAGAIEPGKGLPKELRDAVMLKQQRDVNYVEYAERSKKKESDLEQEHLLWADLDLLVRMGKMSDRDRNAMLETYAQLGRDAISGLRRKLGYYYFGQGVISAYTSYYKQLGVDMNFDLR